MVNWLKGGGRTSLGNILERAEEEKDGTCELVEPRPSGSGIVVRSLTVAALHPIRRILQRRRVGKLLLMPEARLL